MKFATDTYFFATESSFIHKKEVLREKGAGPPAGSCKLSTVRRIIARSIFARVFACVLARVLTCILACSVLACVFACVLTCVLAVYVAAICFVEII